MIMQQATTHQKIVLATPPVYQAPLPLEVHLPMIPQGPAMMAAVLRSRGHHVTCFDAYERSCRQGYFDASEFAAFLIKESPDWLGLSVYSDGYPSALAMIEIAKIVAPDCVVVVGGPHFTLFPDVVPPEVDYVVVGEGELPMVALVEHLLPRANHVQDSQQLFFSVQTAETTDPYNGKYNLTFEILSHAVEATEGSVLQTIRALMRPASNGHSCILVMQDRLKNEALGRLPYPAYELFLGPDVTYQFDEPSLGLDGPMLNLNTSRGCSYGCSFCSVEGVWGKAYSWFPTPWILGLVADLKQRHGLRSVFFREDEFIMRPRAPSAWRKGVENRDEVLALAQGLHTLEIRWAVENRADAFGSRDRAERFFKTLTELGLAGVFVGVESASDKVRNTILNKHLSAENLRNFFKWTHETRVRTVANVMYGVRRRVHGDLLSDNREDWASTEALMATLQPTRIDRYVYVGVPVSPLYFDYLERADYDLIDVNGYLYPKGFADLAREIYGHDMEMEIVHGRPNLRVGPGLLPGIPTTTADGCDTLKAVDTSIRQLAALPGVLEICLTPLRHWVDVFPPDQGFGHNLFAHLSRRSLAGAILTEILKRYRPGKTPVIERLASGPTLAIATLRMPSAEAILLTLHLAHDATTYDRILSVLCQTATLVNTYIRSEFVQRFTSQSFAINQESSLMRQLQLAGREA